MNDNKLSISINGRPVNQEEGQYINCTISNVTYPYIFKSNLLIYLQDNNHIYSEDKPKVFDAVNSISDDLILKALNKDEAFSADANIYAYILSSCISTSLSFLEIYVLPREIDSFIKEMRNAK